MAELGVALSGRISAEEAAEPGRCVGRLTDIGWGGMLRELLADGKPDGAVSDVLFKAVVQVLAAWDWDQRPVAVVTVPSRTRPRLITALGERLAATGRLAYIGSLDYAGGEPPGRQHNSAKRLAALARSLVVPESLQAALADLGPSGGPVLLVDDLSDTGWTMTFAAKLLRGCGAPAVLPFALAVTN